MRPAFSGSSRNPSGVTTRFSVSFSSPQIETTTSSPALRRYWSSTGPSVIGPMPDWKMS